MDLSKVPGIRDVGWASAQMQWILVCFHRYGPVLSPSLLQLSYGAPSRSWSADKLRKMDKQGLVRSLGARQGWELTRAGSDAAALLHSVWPADDEVVRDGLLPVPPLEVSISVFEVLNGLVLARLRQMRDRVERASSLTEALAIVKEYL